MNKRKIDRKKSKRNRFIPRDKFIYRGEELILYSGGKHYVMTIIP